MTHLGDAGARPLVGCHRAGTATTPLPPSRAVPDMNLRAALDTDDLLKIVLVLVIVLLAVELVEEVVGFVFGLLGPLLALVILALIVLFLLDRI
jgi:hypothetical protein